MTLNARHACQTFSVFCNIFIELCCQEALYLYKRVEKKKRKKRNVNVEVVAFFLSSEY